MSFVKAVETRVNSFFKLKLKQDTIRHLLSPLYQSRTDTNLLHYHIIIILPSTFSIYQTNNNNNNKSLIFNKCRMQMDNTNPETYKIRWSIVDITTTRELQFFNYRCPLLTWISTLLRFFMLIADIYENKEGKQVLSTQTNHIWTVKKGP